MLGRTGIPKGLYLIAIAIFQIACTGSQQAGNLSGKYAGYWAETYLEYEFFPDHKFIFTTEGHFGVTETKGKYAVIDSIVLLHPFSDYTLRQGVLRQQLVIREKTRCLSDYGNTFYCKDSIALQEIADVKWRLMDSIEGRILKLDEVVQITDTFPDYQRYDPRSPYFEFEGIRLLNAKEYYNYQFQVRNEGPGRLRTPYHYFHNQEYLIHVSDNKIYRLINGDSLVFVDILFPVK